MAPPSDFAGYPPAQEGPRSEYVPVITNNPVLSGLPLSIVATIVSKLPMLQQYYWSNAGFGRLSQMPELDDMPSRYHPVVTPLGERGPMLEFGPDLVEPKYTSLGSRYYTVSEYHALYKSGRATPLQVIEALLPLTKRGKDQSQYADAWADTYDEGQLAIKAAKASTERYAAGKPLGILDGVPIGVKDDVHVEGHVSHNGVGYDPTLPAFKVQEESAWPIKKLQEAGAIVLGKNTMHQLGSDTCGCNPTQGTATNHLNKAYYPGGSSSGGSSALSTGIVPFVVGSDAGGSARIPAIYNGVYGLKTTHHRTMTHDMTNAVVTPLAATVADLTIAYRVMSQPNPDCPVQGRFALSLPPSPTAKRVMGIYRDWWKDADPTVVQVCDQAIDYFSGKLGYEVIDISIPCISEARTAHSVLCISEMVTAAYVRSGRRSNWLDMFNPAAKLSLSVAQRTPAADFIKCCAMRELLMRHLAFLFQKHPGLLIMTPVSPIIGWPRTPGDDVYGTTDTNLTIKNMMYVFLANMTGTPALAAPVGYVDPDKGQGKLPIGLMATAEWGCEEQLLSWASEAEAYLNDVYEGGRRKPETWLDVMDLVTKNDKPTTD
ncbi:amidase signature domain-containing protein [Stachybotrys elegans]|uniref:Amidase signature domain-containing protein n=1 Tax=Stachybotrys elegans TaxID=80388 RepID=A0A8K0WRY1_9HYPO|nr:amidase signature domain-containing protein [Stachybotrys elegans]